MTFTIANLVFGTLIGLCVSGIMYRCGYKNRRADEKLRTLRNENAVLERALKGGNQ